MNLTNGNSEETTGATTRTPASESNPSTTTDECIQLEEYFIKFIELVPDLKEIDREEKIKKILHSSGDLKSNYGHVIFNENNGNENDDKEEEENAVDDLDSSYIERNGRRRQTAAAAASVLNQQLESLQNLDINSKTISDLQILQSVLDYIRDLKSKVDL